MLGTPETKGKGEALSESQERGLKRLADLKAYLEKRLGEHEDEVKTLRSFLEIVDSLLAEKSYRKMEIPKPGTAISQRSMTQPGITGPSFQTGDAAAGLQTIRTMSGVHLADLRVEGKDLRIIPSTSIRFEVNAPPLKSFLMAKVLEPFQAKDVEAAKKGELSPDRVLSYNVNQEGSLLKEVRVKNYGDERRLNEIRNAVRWTLRRMYEKTLGT